MTQTEALKLALEALEANDLPLDEKTVSEWELKTDAAITAIKAALEAKDEPVAWFWFDERDGGEWIHIADNQINADKFGNAKVIPLYTTPPQQEAKDEPDYKALWQQMCERCDELDKKLAQPEHGWTPERIAGMARLKAQQDKRLEPQRTWIGLTNQELADCWDTIPERAMRRVEAKLKELNT